jgi:hypothetical protein
MVSRENSVILLFATTGLILAYGGRVVANLSSKQGVVLLKQDPVSATILGPMSLYELCPSILASISSRSRRNCSFWFFPV